MDVHWPATVAYACRLGPKPCGVACVRGRWPLPCPLAWAEAFACKRGRCGGPLTVDPPRGAGPMAWRVRRPLPRGALGWPAVRLGSPASWRASACAWPCRCLRRPAVGCLRRGTFGPRTSFAPSTRCSPVARLAANDLERRPCALVAASRCPRAPCAPPAPPLPEGVGFVGGGCSPEGEQSATGAASEEVAGCSN